MCPLCSCSHAFAATFLYASRFDNSLEVACQCPPKPTAYQDSWPCELSLSTVQMLQILVWMGHSPQSILINALLSCGMSAQLFRAVDNVCQTTCNKSFCEYVQFGSGRKGTQPTPKLHTHTQIVTVCGNCLGKLFLLAFCLIVCTDGSELVFCATCAFIWVGWFLGGFPSGKKKEHFGSRYSLVSGGLPREGVGAKKFGMSLETKGKQTFWRDIPGKIPGSCLKSSRNRKFVFNF